MRTPQNKNEIDEIWNSEDKIKEKDLKYETNMYKQFEMIRSFGDDVYTSKKKKEITEWILYLWLLKIVKHLIFIDYCFIFQKKKFW